ncbi:MAG: hypothetical protein NTW42_07820 [Deltaproteobacteria bacterium]|nr:hypothetical protein [Deltaproteobacteria bacterium]
MDDLKKMMEEIAEKMKAETAQNVRSGDLQEAAGEISDRLQILMSVIEGKAQ